MTLLKTLFARVMNPNDQNGFPTDGELATAKRLLADAIELAEAIEAGPAVTGYYRSVLRSVEHMIEARARDAAGRKVA